MAVIAPNKAVTDTRQSPNYSSGRPAGDPNVIVIHHWGVDGQSHQNVVNYLCRSGGNSSAHYVASAGRVTQIVSDRDRAWHAGSSGNPRGIGIECRPEMSDADFETVAQLIAAIRGEWGNLPLRGHQDYMSTACPGRWYSQLSRLSARADAIRAGGASAPAASATSAGTGTAKTTTASTTTPTGLEEVVSAMKATHLVITSKGTIYIVDVLAGTYRAMPSTKVFQDTLTVLQRVGAKVVEWKTFAKTKSNEVENLAAFGTLAK